MAGFPPLDAAEVERRLSYVPPDPRRIRLHTRVRQAAQDFGVELAETLPDSAEKALAVRALEHCLMLANQCIALNVPDEEET